MNISNTHNCFGCGVCAAVCAKNIIDLELNNDGFYEPRILEPDKCNDCGLCVSVCSFQDDKLAMGHSSPTASYAAWSKDTAVRRKCSSGGVGFELGRKLLADGYKVCGVRYNVEAERAEHYVAGTVEELVQTIGSKYIQSYTVDGFKAVTKKDKWLVTGTPCQIDSFRRYIKKFHCEDNFVLMDFFCHSVPSMLAWKKYIHFVEKQLGHIAYVSWRNKFTGWHDSWAMGISSEAKADNKNSLEDLLRDNKPEYYSRLSKGDVFYKLFLGDYCSNPACSKNCKFKYDKSSADIRIGDLWGETYASDEKGVSAAVAFTEKGKETLNTLNCEVVLHPFETVAEGQMKKNCGRAYTATIISKLIRSSLVSNSNVFLMLFRVEKLLRFPSRLFSKLASIFNS